MRKRNLLLITVLLILVGGGIVVSIWSHAIYMDAKDWRDRSQHYNCGYSVRVGGLSGRDVLGPTVIMVPIPATKEGRFFTPRSDRPLFTRS